MSDLLKLKTSRLTHYFSMSLSHTYCRAEVGIESPLVTIEVHLTNGLPRTQMVGLAETAVRESKDRIRSALISSGFEYPHKVVTINLSPADLPKHGSRYDLGIAMGILASLGILDTKMLQEYEFMGELALSGEIKKVSGVLPVALRTIEAGRKLIVPSASATELSLLKSEQVFHAASLVELVDFFSSGSGVKLSGIEPFVRSDITDLSPCLNDVKGQHIAKRALVIAATGSHNLLMIGPPGTGKSMLASRLPGLMPPLEESEKLELAVIRSLAAPFQHLSSNTDSIEARPFRAPHHSISPSAVCGGGGWPRPGEISLAHQGVLFLDEIPEFSRSVLESLREPLETGKISISRSRHKAVYPAQFQLVATMNPCPCGYDGQEDGRCECSTERIRRYRGRLSGPLLDRIDLHIEVPPVKVSAYFDVVQPEENEALDKLKLQIITARAYAMNERGKPNARLSPAETEKYCQLSPANKSLLDKAIDKLGLSARAFYKILKISRTIADLEESRSIESNHLKEALGYRKLDRHL